ncbi:YafY family transcriptional regulator [Aureimonas altamirensis]|uniref:helix-turn-helix transcriptional regulator n=1 Tax=Aureimonas altamirensis TaxID=370622 RepID=UPI001E409B2B|nr:YafY family protein [Aureimonas altamirensis]UHD44126.1 YafY family transcriptional regulator [Aureimonas altamirensis]
MARSDRLLRLLQALRTLPSPVTAERLAEEMVVSVRTIYRDIETLRAAGATIDGETGFGYRLVEDMALPPQTFTRIEIEALVLGLGEVKHAGDRELARAAETAFAKITATLPERLQLQAVHSVNRIYKPSPPTEPVVDMTLLRRACWEEQVLKIAYVDGEGRRTERKIWPLSIVYLERALILLARCCARNAFRRFRIDRIAEATETGESFRPHRVPLLREFVEQMIAEEVVRSTRLESPEGHRE